MSKVINDAGALADAPSSSWGQPRVFLHAEGNGKPVRNIRPPAGTKRFVVDVAGYPGTPELEVDGGTWSFMATRHKHDGTTVYLNHPNMAGGHYMSLFYGDRFGRACTFTVRFDMVKRGTWWVGSVRGFQTVGTGGGWNEGDGDYFDLNGRLVLHDGAFIQWNHGYNTESAGPYVIHAVAYG